MNQPVVLRIYQGDKLIAVRQFLHDEQIVIGRPDAQVQVSLDGDEVSPIHALIEKRGDSFYLADLGSQTGTTKNGVAILDEKILHSDQFQIGSFKIEFYLGVPKPKAPPPRLDLSLVVPPENQPAVIEVPAQLRKETVELPQVMRTEAPAQLIPPPSPIRAKETDIRHRVQAHGHKKKGRWGRTYAPPSKVASVNEVLKSSKGTVIEILLAWQERVVSTYHFSEKKTLYVGTDVGVDVYLPLFRTQQRKVPFVQIDNAASIFLTPQSEVELSKNNSVLKTADLLKSGRLQNRGTLHTLVLEQGEMVKVHFGEGIYLIVRYVSHAARPLGLPLFDFTGSEFLAVAASALLAAIIGITSMFYTPDQVIAEKEQPLRAALIITDVPKVAPVPPPPVSQPIPVEEVKVQPVPQAPEVKQTKTPEKAEKQAESPNPKQNAKSGESGGSPQALKPRDTKNKSKEFSSAVKQGGAVKVSAKEGAQMKSKDASQSGIFSVFGGKGKQKELDQGSDGAGELAGLADQATGKAGQNEDRAGDGLGSKFKDTGASGRGRSNVGVSGISLSTKGRGNGDIGYGAGGLGGRKSTRVVPGGSEEEFRGSVDKEAIRRVIRSNLRSIQLCYEKLLNRDPTLIGKLVVEIDVGEHGRVLKSRGVQDRSSIERFGELSECVVNRLKVLQFPEPPHSEAYSFTYPFTFSPGG